MRFFLGVLRKADPRFARDGNCVFLLDVGRVAGQLRTTTTTTLAARLNRALSNNTLVTQTLLGESELA